ncbi:MAG: glycoside hydrolase family 28 protein [Pelobium sp.]
MMKFKVLISICTLASLGFYACGPLKNTAQVDDPWSRLGEIRKQIVAPKFKNQDFKLTDYGAATDSNTLSTQAFVKAIAACAAKGGGRVMVPNGVYLTGPIHLKSNVNLHLADGAKIKFSRNPKDYLPLVMTRFEGMELMNYSPLIYAYEQENIAITGNGILDGNANNDYWWPWKAAKEFGWKEGMASQQADVKLLTEMNKQQVDPRKRIFGEGHYLRPTFIQPYRCKNILIADVKIINAPMWNVSPALSENITIRNLKIITHGPNNDGCDPEACKNVWIKDCLFDTGDDCIAIKSGRNEDGRNIAVMAENHIIEDCEMKDGHGGVVIGSEISGGARNIYAQNLKMDSPDLDRVLRIKTSSLRGGVVENVFLRNIEVGTYKEAAIKCNMFYENPGDFIPTIRNIVVENMNVKKGGKYGILVNAYEQSPVENLRLINCTIQGVQIPVSVDHVKNMQFKNVVINGKKMDETINK